MDNRRRMLMSGGNDKIVYDGNKFVNGNAYSYSITTWDNGIDLTKGTRNAPAYITISDKNSKLFNLTKYKTLNVIFRNTVSKPFVVRILSTLNSTGSDSIAFKQCNGQNQVAIDVSALGTGCIWAMVDAAGYNVIIDKIYFE